MSLHDDTWKCLVPKPSIDYLAYPDILEKCINLNRPKDALQRIEAFATQSPYREWCKKYLQKYIKEAINRMTYSKKKPDILAAVAESLFSIFPIFKGLLRLRDEEVHQERERTILKAIQKEGKKTVEEVESLILNSNIENNLLKNDSFRNIYANALLKTSYSKNDIGSDELELTEVYFSNMWRKSLAEEDYLRTLMELYDTNLDDLWILLRDYGFDPSYVKGKTIRAQLRSFMQLLAKLDQTKIVSILQAIHKEHPDIQVFHKTYNLAIQLSCA